MTLEASTDLREIFLLDEHRRTLTADREAELIIRSVLHRLLWVLATALRCSAYVPLLREAAWQHGAELNQFLP
jgi:hypothetical protein